MLKKTYSTLLVLILLFSFSVSALAIQKPYFRTREFEEYEKFIQTEDLSDSFVLYEDVSFLGEFNSFNSWNSKETSYSYSFRSMSGEIVSLTVATMEEKPFSDILINESEDLRTYWNTVSGRVIINDVAYEYVRGRLNRLFWWKDGLYFELGFGYLTEAYPYVEGDFICQLLMRDTAEDAIEVLLGRKEYTPPQPSTDTVTDTATDTATTDAIPSGGENVSFPWLWIALPVGAVVIFVGAAFVLLRKKRKHSVQ
ncbi:MAG: hypothetical protein J6C26_03665 [Clostridia bacterium]|nr:hypothetical protein [Clostridia bacterium]